MPAAPPKSYVERLRMDPARPTVPAGQRSGHSVRLDNHFRDSKGPCRAPAYHFDAARRSRRSKETTSQSPLQEVPAGVKSGQHVRLDNHFSSTDGPCRAPYWHFDAPKRGRMSPESCTDPIAFRYEEGDLPSPKMFRRHGYEAKSAVGTWSLSPRGRGGRVPLSPVPVTGTDEEEPVQRGASLRSRSEAHHYRGGSYFFFVGGEEDMAPGGTRRYTKCDLPPSHQYTRQNDQLENRVRANRTHTESSDMQYVLGVPRDKSSVDISPAKSDLSASPQCRSPRPLSVQTENRRRSLTHRESADMSYVMGVSVDPL